MPGSHTSRIIPNLDVFLGHQMSLVFLRGFRLHRTSGTGSRHVDTGNHIASQLYMA